MPYKGICHELWQNDPIKALIDHLQNEDDKTASIVCDNERLTTDGVNDG